ADRPGPPAPRGAGPDRCGSRCPAGAPPPPARRAPPATATDRPARSTSTGPRGRRAPPRRSAPPPPFLVSLSPPLEAPDVADDRVPGPRGGEQHQVDPLAPVQQGDRAGRLPTAQPPRRRSGLRRDGPQLHLRVRGRAPTAGVAPSRRVRLARRRDAVRAGAQRLAAVEAYEGAIERRAADGQPRRLVRRREPASQDRVFAGGSE